MKNATVALNTFPLTAEDRAVVKISDLELDARAIMAHARRNNSDEGRIYFGLCNVFGANWESALCQRKIALCLMAELNGEEPKILPTLAKMVRQGYLRSYMSQGERVWEIAY